MNTKYDHECPSCGATWTNSTAIQKCPFCNTENVIISPDPDGAVSGGTVPAVSASVAPDAMKYRNINDALEYIFGQYSLSVVKNRTIFLNLLADFAPSLKEERRLVKAALDNSIYDYILKNSDLTSDSDRKTVIAAAKGMLVRMKEAYFTVDSAVKSLGWDLSQKKESVCANVATDPKSHRGDARDPSMVERVAFGSYKYYKMEEKREKIEWYIIAEDADKVLLLSVNCIDSRGYDRQGNATGWENSDMRKWLNGEFARTAFTDEELSLIKPCRCGSTVNTLRSERRCEGSDGEDFVFLLSVEQLREYGLPISKRLSSATPYAKEQGLSYGLNDHARWWLRTPGYGDFMEMYVRDSDGVADSIGINADSSCYGVRPAMWVDISGLMELQAE